jgi:tetratricopeptide (TPR) repeat protein
MRSVRGFMPLCFVLLAICRAVPATAESSYPELTPLNLALELSGMAEPHPVDVLIEAALVFSGAPDGSLPAKRQALMDAVQAFRLETSGIQDETQLGEAALAYLHEKLLRSYSLNQMRVDVALDTGVFNCLSSAVLYLIFARSAGLSVKGVLTTDHALCLVYVNGVPTDVETTNQYGFNPGTKKEFRDLFGKTTGYSYVPAGNYSNRRTIGEKELLGRILHDRASLEIQRGNYLAAVRPTVSAYALIDTEEFRKARTAALSNYAVSLGVNGEFGKALAFINEAESAFGPISELEARRADLTYNRLVSLLQGGKIDEAESVLGKDPSGSGLEREDWIELSIFAVQKRAEAAQYAGGYSEAVSIVAEGLSRIGRISILLKTYESYVHNRFAALFNTRKFEEARSVLLSGLTVYPESTAFMQDLKLVEKALQ